jgi:hypothetical protein
MTAGLAVPKQAAAIRSEWLRLAAATADPLRFDPAMIAELPAAAVADPRDLAGDTAMADRRAVHARADQARPVAAVHSPPGPRPWRRLHLGGHRPAGRPAGDRLRPAKLRHRGDALAAAADDPKPLLFMADGSYYASQAIAMHLTGTQWGRLPCLAYRRLSLALGLKSQAGSADPLGEDPASGPGTQAGPTGRPEGQVRASPRSPQHVVTWPGGVVCLAPGSGPGGLPGRRPLSRRRS